MKLKLLWIQVLTLLPSFKAKAMEYEEWFEELDKKQFSEFTHKDIACMFGLIVMYRKALTAYSEVKHNELNFAKMALALKPWEDDAVIEG